eukprot:5514803-Pleurochrysis_carterae.AAC.3
MSSAQALPSAPDTLRRTRLRACLKARKTGGIPALLSSVDAINELRRSSFVRGRFDPLILSNSFDFVSARERLESELSAKRETLGQNAQLLVVSEPHARTRARTHAHARTHARTHARKRGHIRACAHAREGRHAHAPERTQLTAAHVPHCSTAMRNCVRLNLLVHSTQAHTLPDSVFSAFE